MNAAIAPDALDDNDPFVRLENTHRRIEQRLATLEQAASELDDSALRPDALRAIYNVMGFMERGAVRHHEDEERSLFPRLRGATALSELIAVLEEEHRAHAALYAELAAHVRGWPDEGPDRPGEAHLRALVRRVAEAYAAHIQREERELFPAARSVLGADARREMGNEMMDRRANREGP